MALHDCLSTFFVLAVCSMTTTAIDNGFGRTPPMGWRSWNQFQCAINQTLIERSYELLADRSRAVNGQPTSLVDLGYKTAGIDDCWQKCNSGPGDKGFHNASGYPIVDTTVFPDFKGMTAKARSLNIIPGWYGNNCHCADHTCGGPECFKGDVQATLDYGFSSIKLDGCGIEKNITLYSQLFNATGVPVMLENCHNGNPTTPTRLSDGSVDCPMNFFRSSTDIRPTFGSVLSNLESTIQFNGKNLTGPGCWAYPDMLEVGVTNSQRAGMRTLSHNEARAHFGAWCIVSAPLVLGCDLRDNATIDSIWDIISNRVAIKVNQAWYGDAGIRVKASGPQVSFLNCNWSNTPCVHEAVWVWRKHVSPIETAVLIMNNAERAAEISVTEIELGIRCPDNGCRAYDIWQQKDVHNMKTIIQANVASRDTAFYLLTHS
eukprot:m.283926 g.283926  ORF g.283926 m.283926 type:complete len:431 (-) comp19421_c0_seq10:29-1321(-)